MSSVAPPARDDRRRIDAAFERASAGYESAAGIEAQIADELFTRIESLPLVPRVVLDLGTGSGRSSAHLKTRYRRALVLALDRSAGMLRAARRHRRLLRRFQVIRAEAMALPLRTGSVDLVFSSLLLPWCEPQRAIAEIRRVLRPGGVVALSTLGPDTLIELRRAWAAADDTGRHLLDFLDPHDVGDLMLRSGLADPVLDVDRLCLHVPDLAALRQRLRASGAVGIPGARGSLTGRGRLRRLEEAYEAARQPAGLPVSLEVIYALAWGAAGAEGAAGQHGDTRGEFAIPAASIGRRRHERS